MKIQISLVSPDNTPFTTKGGSTYYRYTVISGGEVLSLCVSNQIAHKVGDTFLVDGAYRLARRPGDLCSIWVKQ